MNAPKFILPHHTPIDKGLLPITKQQLDYCVFSISKTGDIHQNVTLIRQTTKHLRAYLILINPKAKKRLQIKTVKFYKSTAQSIAQIRDLKTQYQQFKNSCEVLCLFNTPFFSLVSEIFNNKIKKEIDRLNSQKTIEVIFDSFEEEVRNFEKEAILIDPDYAYRKIFKIKKEAKSIYRKLELTSKSKEYHQLRKYVKYLSVQLTLFKSDPAEAPANINVADLTKLAHLLGLEHDLEELTATLDSHISIRLLISYTTLLRPYLQEETMKVRKKILKLGKTVLN